MNDNTKILPNSPENWDEYLCIQGCVQGKLLYQEQLYKYFYPTMMAIVKRYCNDEEHAITILHNGFLRVFKNIKQFNFNGSFEGWIRRIIIHAISDYYKRLKFKAEVFNDALETISSEKININIPYDYNKLLNLLHQLPPTTKIVVNLFFIDEYTHKDIAQLMNISINTSKWHVAEGRKLLIKMLKSKAI